jgi:ATP-binding cassette subfamily F protein uup
LIVLDEPTNDLDAETLELLEEQLVEFPGTLLVVSHDREFLNNVVTSTIAFETNGPREYVGGYDDWLRQRSTVEAISNKKAAPVSTKPAAVKKKLTYNEQRELKGLPEKIETLETEIGELHTAMAEGDFYKQPAETIATKQGELKTLEAELTAAYARWEELEG